MRLSADGDADWFAPLAYTLVARAVDGAGKAQLVASVKPVKNTSMYEGRIKGPTGDWLPSVFTGDPQHVTFEGLTPGAIYPAQVRALGGSTGQSDWSDPSSHMATYVGGTAIHLDWF